MEEFDLSKERENLLNNKDVLAKVEDVNILKEIMRIVENQDKEFIKRLKATMLITPSPTNRGDFIKWLANEMDKLAGEKLAC